MSKTTDLMALRLDDPGASTKRYEVYSNHVVTFRGRTVLSANWLFLKYLPPFKRWGPYREMTASEWDEVFEVLDNAGAKLTVAVTATWVEDKTRLIPFPEKFPQEAAALKRGVNAGLIEIANHGLTHCVIENNAFKPKLFSSNRKDHREFWDWIDPSIHDSNICRAQEILQNYFDNQIVTFVPPGNVFTENTLRAAKAYGLNIVNCQTESRCEGDQLVLGNEDVLAFHDRELVLYGVVWLKKIIAKHEGKRFCTISELADHKKASLC